MRRQGWMQDAEASATIPASERGLRRVFGWMEELRDETHPVPD